MKTVIHAAELDGTHLGRIVQIWAPTGLDRMLTKQQAPIAGELLHVAHDRERTYVSLNGISPAPQQGETRGPYTNASFPLEHDADVVVDPFEVKSR